nr:hypothetical protein [Tanacetum cinerariifolium]
MDIDALYNILKQNQGDVNDALGYKKKAGVVTSDPLALVVEKTKVSKRKEKVVVSSDSKRSGADDFSELKKITALLAKAFNQIKFYSKPTNNNLRTSSTSQSANKKQEFVKSNDKKVLSDSDEISSSAEETIAEVAYYTSESESKFEYETSEYYDNSINYGLFVNDNDDQENFHDAIESASENFIKNHIDSQTDYDKYEKRIEKANQQTKDLENQNKDLQDKYDVLINQVNTFEEQNNEVKHVVIDTHTECQAQYAKLEEERYEYMIGYSALCDNDKQHRKKIDEQEISFDKMSQVLQDQLKVKHVVIDTHTECQAQYAKLEEERYEYMVRYSALCDNDKQHRKKIYKQEILFDKMSRQLVEMNNNVLRLQEKILEKETKISELKGCVSNKDVEIEMCLERLNERENKLHKIGQTNQTIHMIMPSKDTLYNGKKGICFENLRYFEKAKDLRPSLYDEKVIDLGYTLMFLIHSDEALEIEKFKRARENKIEFAYDYGNLNASYVNEKINFSDDYFQE